MKVKAKYTGKDIKKLCDSAGSTAELAQNELAASIGVSTPTIYAWIKKGNSKAIADKYKEGIDNFILGFEDAEVEVEEPVEDWSTNTRSEVYYDTNEHDFKISHETLGHKAQLVALIKETLFTPEVIDKLAHGLAEMVSIRLVLK